MTYCKTTVLLKTFASKAVDFELTLEKEEKCGRGLQRTLGTALPRDAAKQIRKLSD